MRNNSMAERKLMGRSAAALERVAGVDDITARDILRMSLASYAKRDRMQLDERDLKEFAAGMITERKSAAFDYAF